MVGHGFIKRAQGFTGGARDEVKVRLDLHKNVLQGALPSSTCPMCLGLLHPRRIWLFAGPMSASRRRVRRPSSANKVAKVTAMDVFSDASFSTGDADHSWLGAGFAPEPHRSPLLSV